MALTDITGVFSRYFVVGFFLPAYVALVSLWLLASSELVPNWLEAYSEATQLLILAAVGLVAGLVLSGLSYYITRVFEGYPLDRMSDWPVAGRVYEAVMELQRSRYDALLAIREDKTELPEKRQRAAWCLDRFFPKSRDRLLPTRVGNAIRAFERHSNERWGLDGVTIWPRIEAVMGADERELHVDAKVNFYVFINAAVGAVAVGICLVVDKAVNAPQPASYWPLYAIPFGLGYVLYRAAIGPAVDWGDCVRSSVDLHRLDIYEKLGVRSPKSFSDERALADRVNKALLYAHPLLSDDLWRSEAGTDENDSPGLPQGVPDQERHMRVDSKDRERDSRREREHEEAREQERNREEERTQSLPRNPDHRSRLSGQLKEGAEWDSE
jgi:hypothetical protein